jgi:hypothetical protein
VLQLRYQVEGLDKKKGAQAMKVKDKATVISPFHAYSGRTGTITEIGTDDEGDFVFIQFHDAGKDIMFEPSDIKVVDSPAIVEKNGKYYMTGLGL